jgi:apolipoprotein N-acyltransferase
MSLHGYLAPSRRIYLLTAPLALVAAEALSKPLLFWEDVSIILIGISYGQAASPLLPVAAFSGQSAVTLVTAFAATALVFMRLQCYRVSLGLLAGVLGLWWLSVSVYPLVPDSNAAPLRVGLAQGNWTADEQLRAFSDPAMLAAVIGRYQDLHQQAADLDLELTVFPENALPGVRIQATLPSWEDNLRGLPPALFGSFFGEPHPLRRPRTRSAVAVQSFLHRRWFTNDYRKLTSSALLWDGQDLNKVYEKRKLVPFYETFNQGERLPLAQVSGQPFGVLICYDSVITRLVLEHVRQGATFLMIPSNTNYFEGSPTPRSHLRVAQLVAASSRKYVGHVSHRGPSGIIAPDGRLVVRSQPQQVQLIHAEIMPNTVMTLYARAGEWLAILALLVMFFWTVYTLYQRRALTKAKGAVSRVLSRLH